MALRGEGQIVGGLLQARGGGQIVTDRSTMVSSKGMETVTISPEFKVVIPRKVCEAVGLRSGEEAKVFSFRNRIEIVPVRDIRTLRSSLKGIDTSFECGRAR